MRACLALLGVPLSFCCSPAALLRHLCSHTAKRDPPRLLAIAVAPRDRQRAPSPKLHDSKLHGSGQSCMFGLRRVFTGRSTPASSPRAVRTGEPARARPGESPACSTAGRGCGLLLVTRSISSARPPRTLRAPCWAEDKSDDGVSALVRQPKARGSAGTDWHRRFSLQRSGTRDQFEGKMQAKEAVHCSRAPGSPTHGRWWAHAALFRRARSGCAGACRAARVAVPTAAAAGVPAARKLAPRFSALWLTLRGLSDRSFCPIWPRAAV